ncbi:hypothetical protein [Bradyrhizobium viridifuturi]|uniref:hypothetical protein n=1 Tax=Bradyrhizobium viridifuturi TaxID=1654716 RepID=UPI001AEC01F3|nr:hypothetical protein [Bradyrhizobium viridifuturi]
MAEFRPFSGKYRRAADRFRASNRKASLGLSTVGSKDHVSIRELCDHAAGRTAKAPERVVGYVLDCNALLRRIDSDYFH